MLILLVGLVLFLGTHSVSIVARQWRDRSAARFGEPSWKGIYTLLSLGGLALIIWGYAQARPDSPVLYLAPAWTRHVAGLLMLVAMIALAVSVLPAGRLKGMLKHPMLLSVKVWAFAHLVANGDLASVLLFGAFLAWAVTDRISLKRRNAPIAAAGALAWDIVAIAAGVAIYLLFVWRLHLILFGVLPFG